MAIEGITGVDNGERESGPYLVQTVVRGGVTDYLDVGARMGFGAWIPAMEIEGKPCLQSIRWGLCGLTGLGMTGGWDDLGGYVRVGAIGGVSPMDWLHVAINSQALPGSGLPPMVGVAMFLGRVHRLALEVAQGSDVTFASAGYLYRWESDWSPFGLVAFQESGGGGQHR